MEEKRFVITATRGHHSFKAYGGAWAQMTVIAEQLRVAGWDNVKVSQRW